MLKTLNQVSLVSLFDEANKSLFSEKYHSFSLALQLKSSYKRKILRNYVKFTCNWL